MIKIEDLCNPEGLFIPVHAIGSCCMKESPDGVVFNDLPDDFTEIQNMEGVSVLVN